MTDQFLFSILWLIWLLAFVGIEYLALRNKSKGDTLSETIWTITKYNKWLFGIFLAFWLVLGLHFFVTL